MNSIHYTSNGPADDHSLPKICNLVYFQDWILYTCNGLVRAFNLVYFQDCIHSTCNGQAELCSLVCSESEK